MDKNINRREFTGILGTAGVCAIGIGSGLTACSSPKTTATTNEKDPRLLWDKAENADKIIVVSDLHFGVEDSFAQNVASKPMFVEFIDKLIEVGDVRELASGRFLLSGSPLNYPSHNDSDTSIANALRIIRKCSIVLEEPSSQVSGLSMCLATTI